MNAPDEFVERLRALDACAVSDARDRLGLPDGVATGIGNLTGHGRVSGRTVTVLLGQPLETPSTRHLGTQAIEAAGPGEVIVIAHQGRTDCAGWGGNMARAAAARGVEGTLIHGAARDIDEAREIGYQLYASSATPRTARGRTQEHSWNQPIDFDGVAVSAGDYVVADATGIVFVAAADIDAVLEVAEEIAHREAQIAAAIAAGTPVSEAMGADYERMVDRNG